MQGTQSFVILISINDHTFQPMLERMAAGNLLLSSSILLNGSTYTRAASLEDILNLKFFSEKTYLFTGNKYLFAVRKPTYLQETKTYFL